MSPITPNPIPQEGKVLPVPSRIGGMATPLGVYMTTGPITAGAKLPGLLATGVMFACLTVFLDQAFMVFESILDTAFLWWRPWALLNPMVFLTLQLSFSLGLFLAAIRFTPMAGLHAAEHMTINALESGDNTELKTIQHHSRIQERCGTNLGIIIFGLQWWIYSLWILHPYISVVGMVLYTVLFLYGLEFSWKPLGTYVQTHFTTKNPSEREILSGKIAADELLEKYATNTHGKPGFLRKLWGMGILQMSTAFVSIHFALNWLLRQLPSIF